jgi:hypothetical protein
MENLTTEKTEKTEIIKLMDSYLIDFEKEFKKAVENDEFTQRNYQDFLNSYLEIEFYIKEYEKEYVEYFTSKANNIFRKTKINNFIVAEFWEEKLKYWQKEIVMEDYIDAQNLEIIDVIEKSDGEIMVKLGCWLDYDQDEYENEEDFSFEDLYNTKVFTHFFEYLRDVEKMDIYDKINEEEYYENYMEVNFYISKK